MSKNNKLKEYFEHHGLHLSATERRTFIQEYNNNEMPLSDRIAKILSGQDNKIIEFIKTHKCPNCDEYFFQDDAFGYCSTQCLNEDMPF